MNSLFSFLFLKRISIAFFITRRAFRSKVARVPRTTLSTTIPASAKGGLIVRFTPQQAYPTSL